MADAVLVKFEREVGVVKDYQVDEIDEKNYAKVRGAKTLKPGDEAWVRQSVAYNLVNDFGGAFTVKKGSIDEAYALAELDAKKNPENKVDLKQADRIVELQKRVGALEGDIVDLRSQIDKLESLKSKK